LAGEATTLQHTRAGYLKTDMLIRPALVFDRRHRQPAVVTFENVALPAVLRGWIALEDDDAKLEKRGTVRVTIEVQNPDDGQWRRLYDRTLPHRPGQIPLQLDTADLAGRRAVLRVTAQGEGKRPPEVGFDLELPGGA
jgi:hypothetical protein